MIEYKYLRTQKAAALRRWHEEGLKRIDNIKSESYDNAIVLPVRKKPNDGMIFGLGGVINSHGDFVEKSGIEKRIGGLYPHTISKCEDSKVVYCGYWVKQWGHFLVEAVARVWYFFENDTTVDKYVFISEENGPTELYGNYKEFFELLGISDKLEIINKPIKYREVIVPELAYSRKYYYHEKYKQIFDHIAQKAICNSDSEEAMPERIFLSRSQFPKAQRAEIGLDFLDSYFSSNGYTILYPEKLSLTALIRYLYSAEVCASASGTVPHNLLFAQTGKKAIIVERQTTINEIQANLDIVCALNITYIDGHYSIYPVSAGYGPYIFGYTNCFARFNADINYTPPEKDYFSDKRNKQVFRLYLKEYLRTYGYCCGMEEWQLMYADVHFEAYKDSLSVFGQYLNRTRTFKLSHYFDPFYVKQIIKRMIRR